MSEEEQKAIEYLTNKVEIWKKQRSNYANSDIVYEIDDENKQIQALLNLIDKQQKEIEELKEEHNSKYYHTIKLKELEKEINNDWENKIKSEIKELELMTLDDYIFVNMRDYAIFILKELLGEKDYEH